MRALLDVNFLVALLDPSHVHHDTASAWLEGNIENGWASCPITQNGCIRIISNPRYQSSVPEVSIAATLLNGLIMLGRHEFWADSVSIFDTAIFEIGKCKNSSQITDLYLLGLAVSKGGRLVTFDRTIDRTPVIHATPEHLVVLR